MKGLMKNNFYAVLANAKVFSIFMIYWEFSWLLWSVSPF